MARDTYKEDLAKENDLGINFLDKIYKENDIFGPDFEYQRITDIEEQHKGIDLKVVKKETGEVFYIDEKAQLSYVDIALPTFAFELGSIINGRNVYGWLFDDKKVTDKYYLINSIMTDKNQRYAYCKIYSVSRQKLIGYLNKNNFTKARGQKYVDSIRDICEDDFKKLSTALKKIDGIVEPTSQTNKSIKIRIKEFDQRDTKYNINLHVSYALKEQPINIVIKLSFLVEKGIAKRIF